MRLKIFWILTSALTLFVGCGDSIAGQYADANQVTTYTFFRSGDVRISVLGAEVDAEYLVDGNRIVVSSAQGTVVFTQRDDRLYGPMGLQLERVPD